MKKKRNKDRDCAYSGSGNEYRDSQHLFWSLLETQAKYNCNINCPNGNVFPSNDLFFADKAPRAAPRMKEDDSDKLTKQLHTYFLGKWSKH